jgi:uncharacterized protein YdiU (UPF0061 family)
MSFRFQTTYSELPDIFFAWANPESPISPRMVLWNHALARDLEITNTESSAPSPDWTAYLSGQKVPPGSRPLAQAYAGHQFGHFTMLGDGRALLLGEHCLSMGKRFDVILKGSGRTPYSRNGDGRAALGPMLREYLMSEAMHALGIPTTRSLAVVATGETIFRSRPEPGAVLTRIAGSHLRVGTIEYAAALRDVTHLTRLVDYAIARHHPELVQHPERAQLFLEAVVGRQARLIAQWMQVGFVHGVMNTDNMALSGETIDYGPCAFINEYDPQAVFSSIDTYGRYALGAQPSMAQWNLTRLAEAMLPLLVPKTTNPTEASLEPVVRILDSFSSEYERAWQNGLRRKLGLHKEEPSDAVLIQDFLKLLESTKSDWTLAWRSLSLGEALPSLAHSDWIQSWKQRLTRESEGLDAIYARMQAINPAVIPRYHHLEEALLAAEAGNLSPFETLLAAIQNPYQDHPHFSLPAPNQGCRTFCGT